MNYSQLHMHQYLALAGGEDSQGQYRLWAPGDQVVCHRLQIPTAARRKWTETLPWMLEDQLIGDPDNLHFSLSRTDAGDQATALSVPHAQMSQWQTLCESGPGRVVMLVPDYLALPWEEGGLSLLVEGDRWIVRCGAMEGYAGEESFVAALLARQMGSQPGASLSYIGPKEHMPELFRDKGRHLSDSLDWSFCDYPEELNLLRGEYRRVSSWKFLKSWWPGMAAVSLFLCLALGYLAADYSRLSKEIPLLRADLSASYRSLLGGGLPASDVRSVTEQKIAFRENQYLATQSLPLSILVELDAILSGCNSCQVKTISGDDRRVELRMSASETVVDRLRGMADLQIQVSSQEGEEVLVTATLAEGNNG